MEIVAGIAVEVVLRGVIFVPVAGLLLQVVVDPRTGPQIKIQNDPREAGRLSVRVTYGCHYIARCCEPCGDLMSTPRRSGVIGVISCRSPYLGRRRLMKML
jgi:hypothetical protein